MNHHRSLDALPLENAWLTVGVFDGVHRGHQELLRHLVDGAHAASDPAVVLTFYPHPAVVLGGREDFAYLSLPDEKAALLGGTGVDHVFTIPFDRALADQSAEEFMTRLSRSLGLRALLVGHDFALGRGREGNAARLAELGRSLGYQLEVYEPVWDGEKVISSTTIRTQLRQGEVTEAATLLGRNYAVSGPVVHGDGRGRHINVPTANIAYPPEKLIPAYGIYATWAWVAGERLPAATNIGINPTFTPERQSASLETHILDFSRDLYGQEVRLEFVARLRGEQKFASVDALLEQIRADISKTREILAGAQV
jgi:riboflavin kinase/FMN adenylyltransferase